VYIFFSLNINIVTCQVNVVPCNMIKYEKSKINLYIYYLVSISLNFYCKLKQFHFYMNVTIKN